MAATVLRLACALLLTGWLPAALGAQSAALASRFAAADAHADAAPPGVVASVAALGAYLAQAGSDEVARARALYRWLTGNIDYDAAGFRSGNYGDLTPEGVLRRRAAVCEGYARLAQALGGAMGLRVEVVSGWSKGYGYRSGERFEGRTNHAWNAVQIGGQWRLMDPTWGAGYLDERMQFVRRFQEHYFLTAPEAFVYDHLPEDPRWQLLAQPITADQYAQLAYLRPMFFLSGLRVVSHTTARIAATDRTRVTLALTQPVDLSAVLEDAAGGRRLEGSWALVQIGGDTAYVDAAFPRPGDYVLRMFARPRGATGSLQWVLDYRVAASAGAPDGAFPQTFSRFGATGARLLEPLAGALAAGATQRFRVRAPGALDVAAVVQGRWTHFTLRGDEHVADVPLAAGEVVVYAKYAADGQYEGLLRFTAR
jgi:hypothetical protein